MRVQRNEGSETVTKREMKTKQSHARPNGRKLAPSSHIDVARLSRDRIGWVVSRSRHAGGPDQIRDGLDQTDGLKRYQQQDGKLADEVERGRTT